jgi:hypothetical protein
MARREMNKAVCLYCGDEFTTISMSKHLKTCQNRQSRIEKAEKSKLETENLYYLRIVEPYHKDFWLDLEIRGSAILKDLDFYLRRVWLECCGHLSEFSAGGWGNSKIAFSKKSDDVFTKYKEITHIYDFGSSTELLIKVLDSRKGKPFSKHPIELMARNKIPQRACKECENIAEWLCIECLYESDSGGLICKTHQKSHTLHDNYGEPVKLFNSPRMGVCGYEGSAKPPY